jgi:ketosteroid isomerase-like protein
MSSADQATVAGEVAEVPRRFIAALNARDLEAMLEMITDGTEFRSRGRPTLRGRDGARDLVRTAKDRNLRLVLGGEPTVQGSEDDRTRVAVPVTVAVGRDDVGGTAEFEIRDGKVAAFEVLTAN